MRIQVKDFMSSPVLTAVENNRASEIKSLMKNKGFHAVPIVRLTKELPQNKVTIQGIVTATDLNKEMSEDSLVEEFMTSMIHVIHKDSSAKAAANMMLKKKVHHLVVMDDGEVVGMVSSLDFVKLVASHSLD